MLRVNFRSINKTSPSRWVYSVTSIFVVCAGWELDFPAMTSSPTCRCGDTPGVYLFLPPCLLAWFSCLALQLHNHPLTPTHRYVLGIDDYLLPVTLEYQEEFMLASMLHQGVPDNMPETATKSFIQAFADQASKNMKVVSVPASLACA